MRLSRLALAVLSTSVLAVFAAACSDPVPPTPQGACKAELLSNGGACTITSQEVALGSVSASGKDRILVSGGPESAEVTCQVSGMSSFNVTASISVSGEGIQISIPSIASSATKMAPAMGSVVFASKESGDAYSSSKCAFYFTQGTSQGVASGKIWVSFSCPTVVGGMSTCEISESFAIFENCTE
ncbi:MAG: hypothetical protein ABJE95_34275 [Byssovorax sp.]